MKNKSQKGFTLIELLVVLAVVAVLAGALISLINPLAQIQKGNDARRKSDLRQIQIALQAYYQDRGFYPANTATYQIFGAVWGGSWVPYILNLPQDPKFPKTYFYYSPSGGQAYYLYANLDRGGNDPKACNALGTDCPNVPVANACGGGNACNFGLSSPNVSP